MGVQSQRELYQLVMPEFVQAWREVDYRTFAEALHVEAHRRRGEEPRFVDMKGEKAVQALEYALDMVGRKSYQDDPMEYDILDNYRNALKQTQLVQVSLAVILDQHRYKYCPVCDEVKHIDNFYRDKRRKGDAAIRPVCKACRRAAQSAYWHKHHAGAKNIALSAKPDVTPSIQMVLMKYSCENDEKGAYPCAG